MPACERGRLAGGMARSIHATRAELERERSWRWPDPDLRRKRLRRFARALATKRRIKEEVRRERAIRAGAVPVQPADPDALPVRILDHGPLVHYPATAADVRAILRALPPGTVDGLTEIELRLGTFEQRESAREREFADIVRDPTGRLAIEHLPGVFGGVCLGVYSTTHARIRLFAFVYDPALPGREAFEPFLKLRMLSTLVHEIAHHVDKRTRVARGRWWADAEKAETYAEAREHAWSQEIVVPYLARAYPQALDLLERWCVEQAGVSVPLGLLAGDPRQHLFGDVASQFEELVRDLHSGRPPTEARVDFARELHYAESNELAQRVLDAVLATEPGHLEALTLRAEILVRERRLAEAEGIVRELLARDEGCLAAWRTLTDLERERRAWPAVHAAASRGVELSEPGSVTRLSFVDERARALLELGDYGRLEADVALLLAGAPSWRWRALGYRAIALLRAGRFSEALEVANAGLVEMQGSFWRHELLAVRFEASRALHPSRPSEPLLPETRGDLRHRGYGDWVDRL